MKSTQIHRVVVICVFLLMLAASLSAQKQDPPLATDEYKCGMKTAERDSLIDEAGRNEFNTRYVEISGSTYTRDREFRRRMVPGLSEGDIFTRRSLELSIRSISKMKSIYRLTMDDVEVRLDRKYKLIDIVFCVRQKPKR